MSRPLESARAPRPLNYWNERYPPGYLAQATAAEADPIAIATEIERQAVEFIDWLRLPDALRWDDYRLQAFGAVLFNRYRTNQCDNGQCDNGQCDNGPCENGPSDNSRSPAALGLLELDWPDGSEEVHATLASLHSLLRAPLAVYKMLRIAALAADYPTPQELNLAMAALQSSRDALEALTARLKAALTAYEHYQRCQLAAQEAQHRAAIVGRGMIATYPANCSRSA